MKLVIIIGMTGTGKSTLADRFEECANVIHGDGIQGESAKLMLPYLKSMPTLWEENHGIWKWLYASSDVDAAFLRAMQRDHAHRIKTHKPTIVEVASYIHERFRKTLSTALKALPELRGVQWGEERIYWLNIPAETVHNRRKERGRPADLKATYEQTKANHASYATDARRLNPVVCDTDEVCVSEIEGFLGVRAKPRK